MNKILTEDRISSLILEGKDPVELLKYKFKDIPVDIIGTLVSIDPSKKKSMAQWVCKHWDGVDGRMLTEPIDYYTNTIGIFTEPYEFTLDYNGTPKRYIDNNQQGSRECNFNNDTPPQVMQVLRKVLRQDEAIKESIRKEFNETLKKLWITW